MEQKEYVLVIDDVLINRRLLRAVFEKDYEVIEAAGGAEGLAVMREHAGRPGIVILDLVMPGMDGFGVLEAKNADKAIRDIPVIISTAEEGRETYLKALSMGAEDLIVKPFDSRIIRRRVENILLRCRAERELEEERAYYDKLTGIPNRRGFYKNTSALLAAHPEEAYVMIRWDIGRFKVINDLYGISTGDEVLRHAASFLQENYQDCGTIGRFDADVFYICTKDDPEIGEKVSAEIGSMLAAYPLEFQMIPCIGIYRILDRKLSINIMCDRANLAARTIKGNYVRRFAYFDEKLRDTLIRDQEIVNDMAAALAGHQFEVYLQPKFSLFTNRVIGAEALVRWQHPVRGLVMPGVFIPVFERNGFILKLDAYVWEDACRILRSHMDRGLPVKPISVNVSRLSIYSGDTIGILCGLIRRYHLQPELLELEITESAYTENPEQLLTVVNRLQKLGFRILMDDFGSGYSSLNMLKDLSFDVLKVDMQFLSSFDV